MQISNNLSTTNYLSRENMAREMGFKFNDINEILSNDMGYGMSFPKYARLDRKAQAEAYDRHIYPLSGFTKGDEAKVTIIGKLRGYDPNFTSEQLSDLKNFINESKGLFVEYIQGQQAKPDNTKPKLLRETPYTVNEFLNEYRGNQDLLFTKNSRTIDLLDSDMSVDEFKEEWAKYVLKERFDLTLSGEDAKNAVNILKELNEKGVQNINNLEKEDNAKEKKFTPIQVTKKSQTYKFEADERFKELYKFIKSEFDSGKSMFEILEKVAKLKVDKRA
ncbi:polyribonucleotide nucleotidyltransferase [Campylobacter concisus]|uniref:polyribonucleotide nucleotidyltransferase n=1 Tax=Campylobacter concisus TaxID=199 RepID=UPI000CD8101B|nr:polyribonucleotide nucleotidyltransferase [Campylobacter concisus]MBE9818697.1 polyribonucleotide nucleotidyltransferase [Campylobacter concisus]